MRTIVIANEVEDPARAERIIKEIQSLRNRSVSVQKTMEDFAKSLGTMLGISAVEVLLGIDTDKGTVTIKDNVG